MILSRDNLVEEETYYTHRCSCQNRRIQSLFCLAGMNLLSLHIVVTHVCMYSTYNKRSTFATVDINPPSPSPPCIDLIAMQLPVTCSTCMDPWLCLLCYSCPRWVWEQSFQWSRPGMPWPRLDFSPSTMVVRTRVIYVVDLVVTRVINLSRFSQPRV